MATLPPQPPNKVIFASSFLMAQMMCKMGCHHHLCDARLLNRSGFGAVMPFVILVPYRYLIPNSTTPVKLGFVPFSISVAVPTPHNSRVPPLCYKTLLFYPAHKTKASPAPCAYCIGRQLFSPCPFLSSTLTQLAVGSQHSSRSSFHLLHSFRKPIAVRRAALLHVAALRAVLPIIDSYLDY